MKVLYKIKISSLYPILILFLLMGSPCYSQDNNKFTASGTTELGGSISFQDIIPVSNGVTGNTTTIFSFAPYIGHFVTDGFEIGLNPLGITSINLAGNSTTQIMILFAPSYNFQTDGSAYPFIEALLGYTAQTDGSSESGFSWGARVGVKLAVTTKGLLNISIQYLQITQNPSGADNRYGTNQLAVSAGFTVWL
jgi:opacity protein-like surface antigen